MPQPIQNREFMRAEHELPVHYKHKGDEKFIGGIMRNYSDAGICFETGHPIRPGSDIFIIIENAINNPNILGNCEANYAEVEWCLETANCHICYYKVGAKFYNF